MKLSCGFLLVLFVLSVMIATFSEVEAGCGSCGGSCRGHGKCINGRCKCYGRRDLKEEYEKYQ
uniref:TSA: Tityus bahiensis Tbah00667 mRNA sequence n=1 Tax=Tityus bahiensis TaxID=50343 RepID=A0A0C9RPB8_TITBA